MDKSIFLQYLKQRFCVQTLTSPGCHFWITTPHRLNLKAAANGK